MKTETVHSPLLAALADASIFPRPAPPCVLLDEEVEEAPAIEVDDHATTGLVELLLKSPERIDWLTREAARQGELIPRFLAIGLASLAIFAGTMILILHRAPSDALPKALPAPWSSVSGIELFLAYVLGFVAASGVCLPSFYFYSLLAGVKITMLEVTAHVMKGLASTAVMLMGILPIYVAIALGMMVFQFPADDRAAILYLGLLLPFVAGLWGVWSIYRGFMLLADTLPPERRCRRACFLRRLTFAWAAVYTAVTPVMIYKLWEFFANAIV